MTVICAYEPNVGRSGREKYQFYYDMACKWDLQNPGKMILGLVDFTKHVGRSTDEDVHGQNGIVERNVEGRKPLGLCDKKELNVANTWFQEEENNLQHW